MSSKRDGSRESWAPGRPRTKEGRKRAEERAATLDLDKYTPLGRPKGRPLRMRKHEKFAQELAAGKTIREAADCAGILGTSNYSRTLACRPDIRERVRELSEPGIELAGVHAAYVLQRLKMFAEANMAEFWARDKDGKVVCSQVRAGKDAEGKPVYVDGPPKLDFSRNPETDCRVIKAIKETKNGTVLEMHNPLEALDKLGRYNNLWSGDAVASANADASLNVQIIKQTYED